MAKKHGKKYRNVQAVIDVVLKESETSRLPLEKAVDLLEKSSSANFDASCEVHMHLGIDPKQGEQIVRNTVSLPHGTGKDLKIIAFVPDDWVAEAQKAGAIKAGNADLFDTISKGWLDFDIAVAHPDMMKDLGKVAKILGPKGLMPNPKAGTVTNEITKTLSELKKGRVEFRNDKLGNIHNIFGKVSFGKDKLLENIIVYLKSVLDAKPASVKGTYIHSLTLTTTMGPGIAVDISELSKI